MAITLRQGLSYCRIDGQIFLLDLERGKYFRLTADGAVAFEALQAGEALPPDARGLAVLRDGGLLSDEPHRQLASHEIGPPARRSLVEELRPSMAAPAGIGTIAGYLSAMAMLKYLGFARVARIVERARGARLIEPRVDDTVRRLVLRFIGADRLIGRHDRCLPRSAAMTLALLRRGYPASMVLGVCGRPFHAHCWVQMDDVVLSDRLEEVRDYTPILVI